jgi:hypothetical protein
VSDKGEGSCVTCDSCRLLINSFASRDSSDGEASESEDSSGAEPSVETEEASEITMSCGSTVIGKDERAVFLKKQSKLLNFLCFGFFT